ncbi:hypothetical protein EPK99_10375 [Neorhizobium lilium]|uniref:Antitoxin VbhA domain-containing protein n=1 Tax=Neorhizobium lilium TaxID=2503024 RepID=A0A3S3T0A2_9HYPH|nr:hypothetical protein [Neorhizobium lilium]RWX78971.1 hypothetical protein EPK99_10375 [Neorhizobium lilium]
MTMETRRRIADKVLARMRERGFPMDQDADFTNLIDLWVAGEIAMSECHRRYLGLVQHRNETLRKAGRPPLPTTADDLAWPDLGADF